MFMKLTSINWVVVSNILYFQPENWGRFNIFQMGGCNHQLGFLGAGTEKCPTQNGKRGLEMVGSHTIHGTEKGIFT